MSKKTFIGLFIGLLLVFVVREISEHKSDDFKTYYSYYDAVGNKVIINLELGENDYEGSGTIKMEYAKTSSGLDELLSDKPIPCSWYDASRAGSSRDYIWIESRAGDIYIKDGYAYFSSLDMDAKDIERGCKLIN